MRWKLQDVDDTHVLHGAVCIPAEMHALIAKRISYSSGPTGIPKCCHRLQGFLGANLRHRLRLACAPATPKAVSRGLDAAPVFRSSPDMPLGGGSHLWKAPSPPRHAVLNEIAWSFNAPAMALVSTIVHMSCRQVT